MSDNVAGEEPYLLVEEVAERLGLPLSVLLHRVEAGDIPSRRVEGEDGVHYALRLTDLGIELDDEGMHSNVIDDAQESTLSTSFERPNGPDERDIVFETFDSRAPDDTAEAVLPDHAGSAWPPSTEIASGPEAAEAPAPASWEPRPREPQEPPSWMLDAPAAAVEPPAHVAEEPSAPASAPEVERPLDGPGVELDEESAIAELAVPPPSYNPLDLVDAAHNPRGELSSISLDARELVAGLLDRWERTLEQRIYTEQRQRFQSELAARQNMVKELQMELQTARAEHAAAQAEKDRMLAGKERELADRERDLAETRRKAEEAQHAARRRRWFRGRDD